MSKEPTLKERIKDTLYDFVPFEHRRKELASILVDLVEDWQEEQAPPLYVGTLGPPSVLYPWEDDKMYPGMENVEIMPWTTETPIGRVTFRVVGDPREDDEDDKPNAT